MGSTPSHNQLTEVKLPNRIGYERIAMECSASFAKLVGFVPERIEDLKTVVSEACTNAMQHGNKGRPDAKVTVTINFNGNALNVLVKDEGEGISELIKDPDIERIIENLDPPKGFGLFLIKHLTDQVEFNEVTDRGHAVRMVIKMEN